MRVFVSLFKLCNILMENPGRWKSFFIFIYYYLFFVYIMEGIEKAKEIPENSLG